MEKPAFGRMPERWVTSVSYLFGAIMVVVMMLHITADVFSRWVLGTSIIGTLEFVSYFYMVSVVFMPLGRVQEERGHIIVEVISSLFSHRVNEWVDRGAMVFTLGYVSFIAWWGWQEAMRSLKRSEVLPMIGSDLPLWPSRMLVPLGLAAMAFVILFQLIRSFRNGSDVSAAIQTKH